MDNVTVREERVLFAARKYEIGDVTHLIVGVRHGCPVMAEQTLRLKELHPTMSVHKFTDGFYTNKYNFLDRVEAMALVKECGQPFNIETNVSDDELFSEGVW